jgi:CRP-like cAMP-binding protein
LDNSFLRGISQHDADLLRPHLKSHDFEQGHILFETDDKIEKVYFPVNAVVSLVVTLSDGATVEAAMVGRDGVVGAASALDGRIAVNRGIVQLPGEMMTCELDVFKATVLSHPSLLSMIMRHEQSLYAQAQQSTACMANHDIEARLARWLLRSRDLSVSDILPFTQEFLAEMLGAQRSSVSIVAHTLQQAGMIQYRRGRIHITDVDALQQTSCECYETIKMQYTKLIGDKRNT